MRLRGVRIGTRLWLTLGLALGCTPAWPDLPPPAPQPFPPQTLAESFAQLDDSPGRAAVQLLADNGDAWAARWQVLRNAQHRIEIAYFILDDDIFGLSLLGLLQKKARDGVTVQMLLDARGSTTFAHSWAGMEYLSTLVSTQRADIRIYNPPFERTLESLVRLSWIPAASSNHDKIIVVDNHKSILGGRNIAAGYFLSPQGNTKSIIDSDVLIESTRTAATLQLAFAGEFYHRHRKRIHSLPFSTSSREDELLLYFYAMDDWLQADAFSAEEKDVLLHSETAREAYVEELERRAIVALGRTPEPKARRRFRERVVELLPQSHLRGALPRPPQTQHFAPVQILDTRARPDPRDPRLFQALAHLLESTQESVWIETPYLVLTAGEVDVLRRTGERGVSMTLLTNSPMSSDNPLSQAFFLSDWPSILATVPNLDLFVTGGESLLHSKRIVFDDELTMIGTYNLDPLSDFVNSEVVAVIHSKSFAAENRVEFARRLQQPHIYQYRIATGPDGHALRHPPNHADAGKIVVQFGHQNHCPPSTYEEIERLQHVVGVLRTMPAMRPFRHGHEPPAMMSRSP